MPFLSFHLLQQLLLRECQYLECVFLCMLLLCCSSSPVRKMSIPLVQVCEGHGHRDGSANHWPQHFSCSTSIRYMDAYTHIQTLLISCSYCDIICCTKSQCTKTGLKPVSKSCHTCKVTWVKEKTACLCLWGSTVFRYISIYNLKM